MSTADDGEYGWIHVRQSIHNPNIAVNLQSTIRGGCQSIATTLRDTYASISLFGIQNFLSKLY